jgi:O-antigen/teichoic acid export membrane protein
LSFLIYVPLAFIQVQKKSGHFVIINALKLAIQLFLNILFVVYLGKGVLGVLYSTFIASVITGVVLATYTFSKVRYRFSWKMAGKLFKFGYPFVFSGLGAFILTYSDRYFLKYYAQLSSVGIYSLGYKFGFLLAMFPVRPLFNIWMVQRFEIITQKDYERTFNQFLSWFVILTLSVGLVISLFSGNVLRVMAAPSFWEAYKIVPIIVLAYFFQACTDYFNFGILYSGRTKHMAYGTILSAAVIIILSFLLIPRYGIYGAAWATLISFFVRLSYVYAVSQRLFRIHYALAKPVGTLVIMVSLVAVYSISLTYPLLDKSIVSLSLAVFLLLVFYLLLFSFNIIGTEEKRIIRGFLRAPLKTLGEIKSSET